MITDHDVAVLASYIDRWHNHWRTDTMHTIPEIQAECYSNIAANDILEAVLKEKARLPMSANDERCIRDANVIDIIESYAALMEAYERESRSEQAKQVFRTQYLEALCMQLDYLLGKDIYEL